MQNMTITGKLGRDSELRSTQGGDSILNLNVAVDGRKGRDKVTNWYRVSLWGKRGEALAPYLLKGVSVTVNGEFELSEYEGKPQLNIRANDIALQGGRSEQRGERQQSNDRPGEFANHQRAPEPSFSADIDDEVPF